MILGLLLTVPAFNDTQAQESRVLTLDKITQISDYALVLEFSEPIAINLFQSSRGPWCAIRIVDGSDTLQFTGGAWEVGQELQFGGSIEYADSKHDKLIFTLQSGHLGVETINDITAFKGELAAFRAGNSVKFCMEEVPFVIDAPAGDLLVENVTTQDGEVQLLATKHGGWDGVVMAWTVDYDYDIDLSATESIIAVTKYEGDILALGTGSIDGNKGGETVVKNDPLVIALWLGGSVILALAAFFVLKAILGRKAGRTS